MLTDIFRSQDVADKLCKELEDLNPGSKAVFIKKDISILKNVDEVCEELQRREKKINILFLSAGYMSLGGRSGKLSNPISVKPTCRLLVLIQVLDSSLRHGSNTFA